MRHFAGRYRGLPLFLPALLLLAGEATVLAIEAHLLPLPTSIATQSGQTALSNQSRIVVGDQKSRETADLLREELEYLHGLNVAVVEQGPSRAGDIVLQVNPKLTGEQYRLIADGKVTLEAAAKGGFDAGTTTLVQAIDKAEAGWQLPNVTIEDEPFRDFRALMIDVKNLPHSPATIYSMIRFCRFFKVRYLMLHTGEDQWIGAVMRSSEDVPGAFSPPQMGDYIAYGKRLGVYLIPHNESTPTMPHLQRALAANLHPTHPFANFVDEADGKGNYEFEGMPDDRFWNFMRLAHHRALAQFAAGFPDKKLPYYHIGPCYGEGGMTSEQAARFLDILAEKSSETRMLIWDGVNAKDKHLYPRRGQLAVCYYSGDFSSSKIHDYLREGWNVVNSPFYPLYVTGSGGQEPEAIFREWNVLSGGMGDKRVPFDTAPSWAPQVLGGMLCTWDVSEENHFQFLRARVPVFTEHAWHYKKLPYPAEEWNAFERRAKYLDRYVDLVYRGPDDRSPPSQEPPSWKYQPASLENIVIMQAQPLADPSGVEYRFECVEGDGPSSPWQANSFFIAEDLEPNRQYRWRIQARDMSPAHNAGPKSALATVTTGSAFPTKLKAHLVFGGEIVHGKTFVDATGSAKGYYENRARSAVFPWSCFFGGSGINTAGAWNRAVVTDSKALDHIHENAFSVSLWVNPLPSQEPIVRELFASSEKDGKAGGFKLLLQGETLALDTGIGGKGYQYRVSVRNRIVPGQWSHVAVTFSKNSDGQYEACFFVNGRMVGVPMPGPVAPGPGFGWNLNAFGDLGDVRVYEGVLSPKQIQLLSKPHPGFRAD